MLLRYLLFLLVCHVQADINIMQISDFHFDVKYSTNGDPKNKCHAGAKTRANRVVMDSTLGVYGDYNCDSPLELVENAVKSAANLFPKPDLILWTGDNVPHIDQYDQKYLVDAIRITTDRLNQSFPNVQILPTYGNHDHAPANQFAEDDDLYAETYNLWKGWIKEEANTTFLKGGFYRFVFSDTLFLVLNTNLYYAFDKVQFKDASDPAGQFAFMEDQLKSARNAKMPVNIVAHIAPGMYERKASFKWFQDKYNERFLKVVNQYKDVIKTMIFGHHHTDTFHLVRDENGTAFQVCYMCPAVTPWYSDLGDAANNPAFRIYKFGSDKTWALKDIETYYVDLSKLNKDKQTPWQLEYTFRNAYNLNGDISANNLQQLVDRMDKNDTLYLKYLNYNSVMYKPETDTSKINATQRLGQMCSLRHADYIEYEKCLKSAGRGFSVEWILLVLAVFINFRLI